MYSEIHEACLLGRGSSNTCQHSSVDIIRLYRYVKGPCTNRTCADFDGELWHLERKGSVVGRQAHDSSDRRQHLIACEVAELVASDDWLHSEQSVPRGCVRGACG